MQTYWVLFTNAALLALWLSGCSGDIIIGVSEHGKQGIATAAAGAENEIGVLRHRLFPMPVGYMPAFDEKQFVTFNLFDGDSAHGQVQYFLSLSSRALTEM